MTDEEMAKARADKFVDINFNEPDNYGSEKEIGHFSYYTGFLVGLKAGRPQWHDLRKDPNDLPKPNIAVLICLQFEKWTTTYIAYYRSAINKWQMYNMHEAQRQPIVEDYIDRDEVIAWCEIPTFDKE